MIRWFSFGTCIGLICVVIFTTEGFSDTLDFGRVRIGSRQLDTLHFKNENLVNMMISKTTVSDTAFSLPSHPFSGALSQLAPGEERWVPVIFFPQGVNQDSGQVVLETNIGTFYLPLMGEGVEEVVVINEILADPASNLSGDANGDGIRNSNEDEFVELLNTGKYPINIGGWQIFDAGASQSNRLTFPPKTWIGPSERAVVFGGGEPKGILGKVFVDDGRIGGGFRNSGDEIILFDPTLDDTLAFVTYGAEGNKNTSLVRWPEGIGDWYLHTEFPGQNDLFSPGTARTVVTKIKVISQDTSIAFGDSLHLPVMKFLSNGSSEPIKNEDLNWHTSIENVMIQENSGVWVSKQQGVIQIYSDFQGFLSDTLLIRVLPPKIVRLDVSIEDSLLLIGKTYGLRVEGVISESEKTVLQDGYQIALSDSGIARVVNGEIQALSFGSCEVTVWQGDLLGRVNVQVVAYGDLNADGEHTIWDAVRVVHLILGIEPQATDFEKQSADFNQDGVLDIRDLIGVIQRMFQGEIVSNKLTENRSNIGVRKRIGGVSLDIPSQTIAITFKTKSNQNKSIKASSGHIFWVQDDMGGKGIILPGEEMGVVWQSQTVEVFGASALEAFEWMAWKLDGSSYLLLSQDESGGGVKILGSHPNPLNPSTTIDYRISAPQAITINVYNITGQWICELYDGYMPNGLHKTTWNGYDAEGRVVASGLYFVQLKGALNVSTLKMVVLR